jgi:Response regulator containing CheY-like receiver, AAA-type ATPase, and DNA-binding domains
MNARLSALVIDDKAEVRTATKSFLAFMGFDSTFAEDGLKAKDELSQKSFDLVVSDIEMPNMNGFEVLSFIRKNPLSAKTPVIMLSSLDGEEVKLRCDKLGAQAYIVKPFTMDTMKGALQKAGFTL